MRESRIFPVTRLIEKCELGIIVNGNILNLLAILTLKLIHHFVDGF